jgi:hypothetical protein
VAPLAHQVDPEAGGVVEGLVSPGLPYSHPSGPELAVPSRAKPAVSRRAVLSTGTASTDTPSVQRRGISSNSANLPTVPMELPRIESAAPESEPRSNGPEITEASEVVITSGVPLTPTAGASRTVLSANAPPIEEASATKWGVTEASAVDHGSEAATPATPTRELPVVARLTDQPAETKLSLTRGSTAALHTSEASPARTSRDLPVVSRSVAPTSKPASPSDSASPQAFAAAIAGRDVPVETRPEPLATSVEPGTTSQPVEAWDATPTTSSGRTEENSARTEEDSGRMDESSAHLEPGSEPIGAASERAVQRFPKSHLPVVRSAPTLGARETQAPLTVQRTPITEYMPPPIEPRVQKLEFVTPQVTPTQRTSAATHTPSPAAQSARNSAGSVLAKTAVTAEVAATTPSAQRLPSQDGKRGSHPTVEHSLAVPRRETQTQGMLPAAPVQRLETFEPVASTPATVPAPTVRAELATPGMDATAQYAPAKPAVRATPVSSTVAEVLSEPAAPEVPIGPAVIPEPWPAPAGASAAEPIAPTRHSSPPTVSRLATATPAYPTPRSTGSSRTVAVGPAIPRPTAHAASSQSEPAVAMSFSSMFDSADNNETRSEAEDGFTSVQLESAGDSAAPAAEPTTDTPSTPPVSSSAAPAASGAKPPDLDELARRLYEPLTARLRAELWLDRERAGVTSDL